MPAHEQCHICGVYAHQERHAAGNLSTVDRFLVSNNSKALAMHLKADDSGIGYRIPRNQYPSILKHWLPERRHCNHGLYIRLLN